MRMQVGLALVMALCASCEVERVEYHQRPAFYDRAIAGELPAEVRTEDGTIIRYRSADQRQTSYGQPGDGKPFSMREEAEDGTITLHCLVAEHVLVNTLTCLRNEEYDLIWDQLLAEKARMASVEAGEGRERFIESMRRNRHDLIGTLNRMIAGIPHQETKFTNISGGITRCQLRPQVAEPYTYKSVDVMKEGVELKLLYIK
jgi:hypothetical protein